jgi:general secretion pathway protein G
MKKKFCCGGFTLIELIIVMVIISVLSGISVFALQGARGSARDAKRRTDLQTISSALEIRKSDCNVYPATGSLPGSGSTWSDNCSGTNNTYIQVMPGDPAGGDYGYTSDGTTYTLTATLEDGSSYTVRNP